MVGLLKEQFSSFPKDTTIWLEVFLHKR